MELLAMSAKAAKTASRASGPEVCRTRETLLNAMEATMTASRIHATGSRTRLRFSITASPAVRRTRERIRR